MLIDKLENSSSINKSRSIFNYLNIHKNLSDYYLKLITQVHNYLSEFRHKLFMQANIKHDYFFVSVHFENWYILAFIISGIEQLQPTQMSQETSSALFIFIKLMSIVLGSILAPNSELFLLHTNIENSDSLS